MAVLMLLLLEPLVHVTNSYNSFARCPDHHYRASSSRNLAEVHFMGCQQSHQSVCVYVLAASVCQSRVLHVPSTHLAYWSSLLFFAELSLFVLSEPTRTSRAHLGHLHCAIALILGPPPKKLWWRSPTRKRIRKARRRSRKKRRSWSRKPKSRPSRKRSSWNSLQVVTKPVDTIGEYPCSAGWSSLWHST